MITINQLENLGIKVKSVKNNEVIAHCPFPNNHKHNDKKASFGINLITEKFLCRTGCLKGNSFEELYKAITGKTCIKYSSIIELPQNKVTKLPQIPILPLAIDNKGYDYLMGRGYTKDSIIDWGIKYWESINAIVIPIEQTGYIVRYLEATTARDKYKYVSGTKITNCLFGESKLQFNSRFFIILVEGSLDAIFMHQLGYKNTLALLHTDISNIQMQILKKYNMPVYLLLDGDIPGKEATEKLENKLKGYFYTKKCYLPKNKDPNDLTKIELEEILS